MTQSIATRQAFVLFPLGKKRYALSAGQVSELARQDAPQTFPHTTPLLTGVVLRRNQIVPVADVAPLLIGSDAPARKFFLVVNRQVNGKSNSMAIPVTGECELADAEELPVSSELPPYVSGLLSFRDEVVEVLDLEKLIPAEVRS
jgi:chemotaxis signal transduction protein